MGVGGYERYAIYWAPPSGDKLGACGARWLGWDAEARAEVAPGPERAALPEDLTATPRRYGFHATVKPPFRLAEGLEAGELEAALANLAAGAAPVVAPGLEVSTGLGFCALRTSAQCPDLDALAQTAVVALDGFRAPPTAAELAKRRAPGLTADQEAQLARWGYPYLGPEFRFHLTLSGRLDAGEAESVAAAARRHFAGALASALEIRELALFGDPGGGRAFHLLSRHALTG